MQSLRAAFDRGLDPLSNVRDASDINSGAGLLKVGWGLVFWYFWYWGGVSLVGVKGRYK